MPEIRARDIATTTSTTATGMINFTPYTEAAAVTAARLARRPGQQPEAELRDLLRPDNFIQLVNPRTGARTSLNYAYMQVRAAPTGYHSNSTFLAQAYREDGTLYQPLSHRMVRPSASYWAPYPMPPDYNAWVRSMAQAAEPLVRWTAVLQGLRNETPRVGLAGAAFNQYVVFYRASEPEDGDDRHRTVAQVLAPNAGLDEVTELHANLGDRFISCFQIRPGLRTLQPVNIVPVEHLRGSGPVHTATEELEPTYDPDDYDEF